LCFGEGALQGCLDACGMVEVGERDGSGEDSYGFSVKEDGLGSQTMLVTCSNR